MFLHIWWGTGSCLTKYNSSSDTEDTLKPILHFKNIRLFFKEVEWRSFLKPKVEWKNNLPTLIPNSDIAFEYLTKFNLLPINLSLPYYQNHITFDFISIWWKSPEKTRYQFMLEGQDTTWSPFSTQTEVTYSKIEPGQYVFKVKALSSDDVWSDTISYCFEVRSPWWETLWFRILLIISALLLIFGYIKWRERKLKKDKLLLERKVKEQTHELADINEELKQQNEEIIAQRDEIETQRDLVTKQKEHIEEIYKEVTDSINYAKRIQEAVLPISDTARATLGEHFILFKPKDVISGDFYWTTQINNQLIVTVADCTGHGVPGALMSMMGISFLNEIVLKKEATQASYVLNELRKKIINALQQKGMKGEQKDGMDMSLVVINTLNNQLQFAGANNPLFIVSSLKELIVIEADKMPVAIHEHMENFTNHNYQLQKGDSIYLCSDGYEDQFGGPKNRKFMAKQLKELFVTISDKPMDEQKAILDKIFENWRDNNEQIDDVTIVGLKV